MALALALAACGQTPQPFRGLDRNDKILTSVTVNPGVMIAPVVGLPPPLNRQFADRIAKATQDRDVAATTRGLGQSNALLEGKATTYKEKGRTRIKFEWVLTTPNGMVADRLTSDVPAFEPTANDPWLVFANSDLSSVVDDVSAFLERQLYRPSAMMAPPLQTPGDLTGPPGAEPAAPPAQLPSHPYTLYIAGVTGAPGDGNQALTRAMKRLFADPRLSIPLKLTAAPGANAYSVDATVRLADYDPSTQTITIDWRLRSPDGDVLGNVTQNNRIERGSLSGAWGPVALYASEAAAEGLVNLLLQFKPL